MEEKTCKNCAWFKQHYIKGKSVLIKTDYAHCRKSKKKVCDMISCDKWENIEKFKQEQTHSIYTVLKKTAKRIEDIALILKTDE